MSNHIICFSPSGATLGLRILAGEDVFAADWELTQCFGADHESLSDWTKRVFQPGNNLLFIGATGIAVRAIAPYVREKQSDPARPRWSFCWADAFTSPAVCLWSLFRII